MNMEYLTEIYADLDERIDDIRAVGDVNEELVKIAINNLRSLRADVVTTGRNQGILQKIDTQIGMYDQVARIPALTTKIPIIREQMIVLMIGALEVFLSDVFRRIGNEDPKFYLWVDPKEKIYLDPTLISDEFTLGDTIMGHLKNRGVSFQDLKSLVDAIDKYFGINISIDDGDRDVLILAGAYRNIIVHNRSKIDRGFLNQIRSTAFASNGEFEKDNKISVGDDFVDTLARTVKNLCENIINSLMQRDEL